MASLKTANKILLFTLLNLSIEIIIVKLLFITNICPNTQYKHQNQFKHTTATLSTYTKIYCLIFIAKKIISKSVMEDTNI